MNGSRRGIDDATRRRGQAAFARHLARVRGEVERRLEARWRAKLRDVGRHGAAVARMARAARDLTMRGGKRFRAALLVAAYGGVAPRARRAIALDAGVALELFQSYLLIQDDWMDGDATRRGGPSVHAELRAALRDSHLGDASAILASDLVWGFALETLAGVSAEPTLVRDAVRLFSRIHEDVVIGQQLDVLGSADVEAMHALKTGSYTVRGPLLLGAALGAADARQRRALAAYAAPLGVAFQLRDDLMGAFASAAETGKPEGGDLRAGKRTAVIAEAEGRLDAAGRRALAKVFGRARASTRDVGAATRALEASGARAAVAARLDALVTQAERAAIRLPLAPASRAVLVGAAGALRRS